MKKFKEGFIKNLDFVAGSWLCIALFLNGYSIYEWRFWVIAFPTILLFIGWKYFCDYLKEKEGNNKEGHNLNY